MKDLTIQEGVPLNKEEKQVLLEVLSEISTVR